MTDQQPVAHALALLFHQDALLFEPRTQVYCLALDSLPIAYHPDTHFYLGLFNQMPIYAVYVAQTDQLIEIGLLLIPVRQALTTLVDLALCQFICRAKQLLYWHRRSLFCGQCGAPTQLDAHEQSKQCLQCQTNFYPSIAPAIIVVIQRKHEILLARSPHFAPNLYSALAGFVEAGESCEDALAREVHEEVGLSVNNIRYFGSQSWPFPNSFMLGFHADYAAGDIIINPDEIEDARWVNRHNLPLMPPPYSIARRLIEHVLQFC